MSGRGTSSPFRDALAPPGVDSQQVERMKVAKIKLCVVEVDGKLVVVRPEHIEAAGRSALFVTGYDPLPKVLEKYI